MSQLGSSKTLNLCILSCEDSPPYQTSSPGTPSGLVLELLKSTFQLSIDACKSKSTSSQRFSYEDVSFTVFNAKLEQYPSNFEDYDGIVIPGSLSSSYSTEPWIVTLGSKVLQIHSQKIKTIGICFGHQILAHYGGGTTSKNEKGNVGQIKFSAVTTDSELFGEEDVCLLCSHNDVICKKPINAVTIFSSEDVEFQGLR